MVEKMVTRGRVPTLANRRMLISQLHDEGIVGQLIAKSEGYKTRWADTCASPKWDRVRAMRHQWP